MVEQHFTTSFEKMGTKTALKIPFDPNEVWGQKSRHHVAGSVAEHPVRGALVLDGEHFFLPLGPTWLRDNLMEVGMRVTVILSPEGPQVDQLPSDVASALAAEPQARAFFEGLPTFYRKNMMRRIENAKRSETRAAHIAEAIQGLKDGKPPR